MPITNLEVYSNTRDYNVEQGKKGGFETYRVFPKVAYVRFTDASTVQQYLTVIEAPTRNCQMFSIAPIQILVSPYITEEEVYEVINFCKKAIDTNKRLIMFDVHDSVFEKMKTMFTIHSSTPYKSTNDSRMVLGLIHF